MRLAIVISIMAAIVGASATTEVDAAIAIVVREASGVVADDDLSHAVAAFIGEAIAGHVTVTQADDADAALDALPGADLRQKEVIQGIAATLDAAHLLLVEVHRSAEAVEIAATFHDGLTGRQLSELSAVAPPGALLETVDLLAQRCLKSEPIASLPRRQVIAGPLHLAAERHFLLAVEHYLAQSTQQAILQCLKAIEMHPQHERARLLLAEIYLAADERTLARATLHRALQLLTTLRQPARAATLLRLVDPQLLQAAEMQKLTLALPADWPAGEDVLYDLSWHKQLVLQGRGRAQAGTIEIQMPSARLPLILDLRLTCGNSRANVNILLWNHLPPPSAPAHLKLVIVDPADDLAPQLAGVRHRALKTMQPMPDLPCRVVISPLAAAGLDHEAARGINDFISRGGEVVIIGVTPAAVSSPHDGPPQRDPSTQAIQLAGMKMTAAGRPMTHTWIANPASPLAAHLPPEALIAAMHGLPRASLITGGEGLLLTREAGTSLAAISRQGKLLWIAWPLPWDNSDPRCGRLLALALADTLFEQPLIGRKH